MGKPFTRIYPRQLVSLPESDGDSVAVLGAILPFT